MSDIVGKGLSRLAYQFSDSTKLQGFLEAFLEEYQEIENTNLQLLNERYLDTAIGAQLDGIGEIVGLPRPSKETNPLSTLDSFGFLSDSTAKGFTDLFDSSLGGPFITLGGATELVDDDDYRIMIRGRIIKNQIAMTVDETLNLLSFMFGTDVEIRYFLFDNLKPIYSIGIPFDYTNLYLLDDFPVLIGLEGVTFQSSFGEDSFSFDGDPTGLGFGDINDANIGGNFAKIII